jgi:hypothetical protein
MVLALFGFGCLLFVVQRSATDEEDRKKEEWMKG